MSKAKAHVYIVHEELLPADTANKVYHIHGVYTSWVAANRKFLRLKTRGLSSMSVGHVSITRHTIKGDLFLLI